MNQTSNLDLLAIGAHPDDVELSCGGFLAKSAKLGYQTGVIDLTRGELGSQGTAELRDKEAQAAKQILGLSLRENLGFPDGAVCSDGNGEKVSSQLLSAVHALRTYKPRILLIPHVQSRHPDHGAAGELFTKASFYAGVKNFAPEQGEKHVIEQVLYYAMRVAFEPSFILDITEVQQIKMQAIAAYSSQITRSKGSETLVSSPLSLDAIVARDAYFGSMIGVAYGEGYLSRNAIGVSDPISLFAQYPGKNSLVLSR